MTRVHFSSLHVTSQQLKAKGALCALLLETWSLVRSASGLTSKCSYLYLLLTLLPIEYAIRRVEYALDALIGRSREENELTGDTLFVDVTRCSILRTSSKALLCSLVHALIKSCQGCKASSSKMHPQG